LARRKYRRLQVSSGLGGGKASSIVGVTTGVKLANIAFTHCGGMALPDQRCRSAISPPNNYTCRAETFRWIADDLRTQSNIHIAVQYAPAAITSWRTCTAW